MSQTAIFWPVLIQLLIPFWVLILNGRRKARDRRSGSHDPSMSAVDNKAWTTPVVLTSNNLANQFQLPIVFYVLCGMVYALNAVSALTLTLAWVYVVLRWFHAYVHVTSNHIPSRFGSFVLSTLVLLILLFVTARAVWLAG